jgi:hypothetical protein
MTPEKVVREFLLAAPARHRSRTYASRTNRARRELVDGLAMVTMQLLDSRGGPLEKARLV